MFKSLSTLTLAEPKLRQEPNLNAKQLQLVIDNKEILKILKTKFIIYLK